MREHDIEPVHGLPAALPEGETILWQGAPGRDAFARHMLHVRVVLGYFACLAVWSFVAGIADRHGARALAIGVLRPAGLAIAADCLLMFYAWLVARTTVYTITTKRVVMRIGVALPVTYQIPFAQIDSANLKAWSDGAGDIALSLRSGQKISYLVLWPHARPWRFSRPEPSLRAVADAASVAQILGRALAASAAQPAVFVEAARRPDVTEDTHAHAAA